ncbi:hypothetical protein HH308_15995 [Gordonia sp. TBRC 11910]|uniref:Uncharacterized protein n=1 Tax=Gordonia asplenii TaxID=2725283 RepID=A0A848L0W6_9ACTN|nr:hypothetical protein [Gordonia asplenii]NMO02715.1 hypothetical protein [Gordonia asplenii]
MIVVGVVSAVVAVAAWLVSYRRSTAPRRDPEFFVAVSTLDAGRQSTLAEAELIEEKHHLEARATWPAALVGAAAAIGALFIVLGNFYVTDTPDLWWFTIELVAIAMTSLAVAAWCTSRTARQAVRWSRLYRAR